MAEVRLQEGNDLFWIQTKPLLDANFSEVISKHGGEGVFSIAGVREGDGTPPRAKSPNYSVHLSLDPSLPHTHSSLLPSLRAPLESISPTHTCPPHPCTHLFGSISRTPSLPHISIPLTPYSSLSLSLSLTHSLACTLLACLKLPIPVSYNQESETP